MRYGHLAAFLRSASSASRIALFRAFGDAALAQMAALKPGSAMFLSTCGAGVAWLHLRIDPRPKCKRLSSMHTQFFRVFNTSYKQTIVTHHSSNLSPCRWQENSVLMPNITHND